MGARKSELSTMGEDNEAERCRLHDLHLHCPGTVKDDPSFFTLICHFPPFLKSVLLLVDRGEPSTHGAPIYIYGNVEKSSW